MLENVYEKETKRSVSLFMAQVFECQVKKSFGDFVQRGYAAIKRGFGCIFSSF
jgi:hypothetical protein